MTIKIFTLWLFLFFSFLTIAQKRQRDTLVINDSIGLKKRAFNPLAPSKAAFYSAVLPGLGQAYNKRYWKIPLVYGAIGTGVFFIINNSNEFNDFRDAFRRRLAGFEDDQFFDIDGNPNNGPDVSDQALQDAQESAQSNRELAIIITIGLYALNIIDANVDAHLKQFNISDDLTFKPFIYQNEIDNRLSVGYSLSFKF